MINHKRKLSVAGHRGDPSHYPENTMSAFISSYEKGADMIETDVHLTKDMALILMHDDTVDRTTDGSGLIKDMTLEEVLKLNAGSQENPEQVPLFEGFLEWASKTDLTVNIEIKEYRGKGNQDRCDFCIEKVIELVEKYGMSERILINSFDAYVLEYCYKKWGKKYMLHGFYPYDIMWNVNINPDEYLYCACIFDSENKQCYDHLISVGIEPWIGAGVREKDLLCRCISLGARLITTNDTADVIEKLKDIGEKTMDASKIKIIAMDLDGTLTQHKQPLDEAHKAALDALAKRYKLLMVGAGQVRRIFNQLGQYPIDIIGNYGLQYGVYNKESGDIDTVRDLSFPIDRESTEKKVTALREKHGFCEFRGDNVEYHPSGCITFPILGTKAIQEDKLAFDPDRAKRRKIYDEVCETFSDYCVFVGGSSSFDMAPKPYNKFYALDLYCRENGLSHENVVYIGDDYGLGGNDESVYLSDIPYLTIDDYRDFPEIIKPLLD